MLSLCHRIDIVGASTLSLAAVRGLSQLQQDWWLARATDWLTTSHDVGMFLQPGSLTILLPPTTLYLKFLFLQSRVSFFCDGSKKHPRKVRNRSETCQKQGVDARFSPSIHPSIHRPFRLICPKSGSSYCIGNRRQAVEVCFPCVTGLISWEHQRCRLLL